MVFSPNKKATEMIVLLKILLHYIPSKILMNIQYITQTKLKA